MTHHPERGLRASTEDMIESIDAQLQALAATASIHLNTLGAEYVAQRAIRAALQANPGAVGRLRDVLLGEDVG